MATIRNGLMEKRIGKHSRIPIWRHEAKSEIRHEKREGKDVFEYSVFGSPQQKIGNFTQTKLRCF